MFVHSDGQLKVAHLILNYTPISKSFQASKCVIKAKDSRLHQISVAIPGFLITGAIPEGTLATDLIPEGIQKVALPPQYTAEEEATPSQPTIVGEEEVVKVSDFEDSKDDFEVFNQLSSPEILSRDLDHFLLAQTSLAQGDSSLLEDMGIKRKQRTGLLEVMESSTGSKAPEKTT